MMNRFASVTTSLTFAILLRLIYFCLDIVGPYDFASEKNQFYYSYLTTPLLGQDMTQDQFLSGV